MEKIGEKILEQSPIAAVLLFVFIIFIKYLTVRDKSMREYHAEQAKIQRDHFDRFQEEHLDARKLSREALQYNTSALEANVSATNRNSFAVEKSAEQTKVIIESL